jgi:hypothetical protein
MVHPVQPPERRDGMAHHMLEIDRKVERENPIQKRIPLMPCRDGLKDI